MLDLTCDLKKQRLGSAFLLAAVASTIVLCGCGSTSSSPPPPTLCNTGTVEQLANPTSGQTSVSTNMSQVTIVAYSSANQLYNSYNQWNVLLTNNGTGAIITGGSLRLVSGTSLPHPYASDFYYASSIPQLAVGNTYTASLSQATGACQSISLGAFST